MSPDQHAFCKTTFQSPLIFAVHTDTIVSRCCCFSPVRTAHEFTTKPTVPGQRVAATDVAAIGLHSMIRRKCRVGFSPKFNPVAGRRRTSFEIEFRAPRGVAVVCHVTPVLTQCDATTTRKETRCTERVAPADSTPFRQKRTVSRSSALPPNDTNNGIIPMAEKIASNHVTGTHADGTSGVRVSCRRPYIKSKRPELISHIFRTKVY